MSKIYILTAMVVMTLNAISATHAETMSIDKVLSSIREQGKLESPGKEFVVVEDTLDLSELVSYPGVLESKRLLEMRNVDFKGGINAAGLTIPFALTFRKCRLAHLNGVQTNWKRTLTFVGSSSVRFMDFEDGVLEGGLVARNSEFVDPQFRHMVFAGQTEWLSSKLVRSAFVSSRFKSTAHFDRTEFIGNTTFHSTIFDKDVSFADTRSEGEISFKRISFLGDAEFRRCKFAEAITDFGKTDVTLFAGFNDFRQCVFGKTNFAYVVFRGDALFTAVQMKGEANFSNAVFRGDAIFTDAQMKDNISFKHTIFRGDIATIEGVRFEKGLELTTSSTIALRYHWEDIGSALMTTNPDWRVLSEVELRLSDLGRREGALAVSYHKAEAKLNYDLARAPAMEKLRLVMECLIWGLPTGYGTKLGRVIVISIVCWAFCAAMSVLFNAPLYRIPRNRSKTDTDSAMFRPADMDEPTESLGSNTPPLERWFIALIFMFGILFKVKVRSVAYIEARTRTSGFYPWETFFFSMWVIGAVLLALLAITLANTSPIISQLVGTIAL